MEKNTTRGEPAHAGGGFFSEISPVSGRGKRKIDKVGDEEEQPILTLKPFSTKPKISFERVLVGSEVTKTLYIYNPDASDVTVEVVGVTRTDQNLELSALELVVPAMKKVPFLLTWIPKECGSWCDTLNFKYSRGRSGAVGISYDAISTKKTKTTPFRKPSHTPSKQFSNTPSKAISTAPWKAPQPIDNTGTTRRTQVKANPWKTDATANGISPVSGRGKRKIDKVGDEEEQPILTLKPFSTKPKISFERVLVGSEVTKTLYIYNPDASEVTVEVIGLTRTDQNLEVSALELVVPSMTMVPFHLTWTPKECGSWCDTLNFKYSGGRKGAVGISYDAISTKKTKTTLFRGPSQTPSRQFSNTPSKAISTAPWKAPQPIDNTGTTRRTQVKANPWKTDATTNGNLPPIDVPTTPIRRETYAVPNHLSILKNFGILDFDTENTDY